LNKAKKTIIATAGLTGPAEEFRFQTRFEFLSVGASCQSTILAKGKAM
jgi:hypothetical protein